MRLCSAKGAPSSGAMVEGLRCPRSGSVSGGQGRVDT